MKQLLFLLLLFPCLALAQYQGNANQKITLGEQTTADGLVYRGVAADTTRKPFVDTMAFILLDTNTNIIWQYKKATNNAWTRVGGSISSGLTGELPVANGGTGQNTLALNKLMVGNGTSGVLTPTNLHWDNTNERLGIGTASPSSILEINKTTGPLTFAVKRGNEAVIFFGSGTNGSGLFGFMQMYHSSQVNPDVQIVANDPNFIMDDLGLGIRSPTEKLHVVGNARITAVGAGAFGDDLNITSDGTLTTETSDEKYKYNILPINYGLNTILQLKPVNFQWIKGEENDLGFIAQDVAEIIPEAVNTNWNSDLLMRYNSIIPILTKAIQEQNALIKALEQRILILENK